MTVTTPPTPIAIVGMGCRFGGAWDLHEYWQMCRAGRDAFAPVPADRWDMRNFHDVSRRATDKSYADVGAWIRDIRTFPALILGLPPRRVEVMDPQQRLVIECALEAIEDAGLRGRMPRRTGVYVGVTAQEWRNIVQSRLIAMLAATGHYGKAPEDPTPLLESVENVVPSRPFSAIGVLGNMNAAAVAQELDLQGPAYTTDAACASAMMAIADAVHQLRNGSIDAALAGGVYLCITPDHYIGFSRIGAMSASGHCRPFDARADGFVQGDGGGLLLLKRLSDAERDGDRIYALIHGVAINNDGKGEGPMAPVFTGQSAAIRAAWDEAGLDPAGMAYVETHGTGTDVGDLTELTGLRDALGDRVQRVALGSSKANVGHTMSAAAVAGMIRAALAIHHREIPPMAGFASAKDELGLEGSPWWVPTAPTPWTDGPHLAGVSSFGFGGTNGHAVLGPPPARPAPAAEQVELLLMSASDEAALRALATRTAQAIAEDPQLSLASVCRAWAGRRPLLARLCVVASSREELIGRLQGVGRGERPRGTHLDTAGDPPRIAFMYPGQGAQRTGMLADIQRRFPQVRATMDRMEQALHGELRLPLSQLLYPELRPIPVAPDQAEAELTDTEHCQPALLSVGAALTELLASVGVRPHAVVGHSLGEFTAAAAAGVLSFEEAARFVARRGRAMAGLPGDHGAMAAIMAPREQVKPLLPPGAVVANVNHPHQLVVSGTTPAIEALLVAAEAADIKCKRLQVSHGFHSPVLSGLDADALLESMALSAPQVVVASGIASHPYRDAEDARDVFRRHAISPVEFVRALEQCHAAGADLYLQVGAGGPLASFARGSLPRDHRGVLNLAGTDDHDGGGSLLEALGRLWCLGAPVDILPLTAPAPLATLPASVLPREDYWPIKDEPQLPLKLPGHLRAEGRSPSPPRAPAEAPAPADLPPAGSEDPVQDQVLRVVAKVSAWPLHALKPGMRLIDDLGFDSLMVNDLVAGLKEAFPAMPGLPQELLVNRPSVQDIVEHVRSSSGQAAVPVDDDAPLRAWAPTWVKAPMPLFGRSAPLAGRRVLLVGEDARGRALVLRLPGALLTECSADEAAQAGPADLVLWSAGQTGVPALIAALDRQAALGRSPDLLLLRGEDPAHEALSGVVRAAAREWPQARVKAVTLPTAPAEPAPTVIAEALLAELCGADLTVDLRLVAGERGLQREVMGLAPLATPAATALTAQDTVVITGGTAGIGAALAARLAAEGDAGLLLLGRSAPRAPADALVASGRARWLAVDARDRAVTAAALRAALTESGPVVLVHAAGLLADGPLGGVDPTRGRDALDVKVEGWLGALEGIGPRLRAAVAIGSWAGRFGNRHQAWYGAANAALAAHCGASEGAPLAVVEFGPWTDSDMVQSIPAVVQSAMRAEGVDFVGNQAGLDAILEAIGQRGVRVMGRDLPASTRAVAWTEAVSTEAWPFLLDHAIEGLPVLPLAAAADLLATAALAEAAAGQVPPAFEILDLRLFQGVVVREPLSLHVSARGDRAELRLGERRSLAYQARVRTLEGPVQVPDAPGTGSPPALSRAEFYGGITFHGPMLQGITAIEAEGPDFVKGRVHGGLPGDWIPGSLRGAWTVDPLALDSAMQLSAVVAWTRLHRAGTPMGIRRYAQLRPLPAGELQAEVHFAPLDPQVRSDRFEGSIVLRDAAGAALVVAEGVAAELREVKGGTEAEAGFQATPRQVDFAAWPEIAALSDRLDAAVAIGVRNPYFNVHEGTARNTSVIAGREYVNYSSYNYIGLSGDPRVLARVKEAVDRYGTSVSASRVASGERPFHGELERLLARCQGTEDAILYTAGHATNMSTIGHLMKPTDLILHDELIHDSILQGIKLSGATRRGFRHDDAADLERQLRTMRPNFDRCLVAVEGVYSMDGDICDLPAMVAAKQRHGCLLLVDEAHSFGILGATGQGAREHHGIDGRDVDIWMGTLSKSLASCGGWIAGRKELIRYLKYTSPGFVYSAGLTPSNGMAALASLELMLQEPWRVKRLQDNARLFHDALDARGLDTGPAHGESGVVPVITGNSVHALWLAQRLGDAGINVQPIVYPAVADDAARLRFFLSSTHTEEQLLWTAETIASTLARVRADFPL